MEVSAVAYGYGCYTKRKTVMEVKYHFDILFHSMFELSIVMLWK